LVTTAVASNDAVALLRRFHENGIDIGACFWKGGPYELDHSIIYAALQGRADVIRLLHELGAGDVDSIGSTSALFAAMTGHMGAVRALCELGADLNILNKYGQTPVYMEAQAGHVEAILTLCELGADVNTLSKGGITPVYAAALQDHVEAIRVLCELGADINTPDNEGMTPLHAAAAQGHEKVVKLLRKLGANMTEESDFGTPVEVAQEGGHAAMAEKLTKYTSQCACCVKQATATVKLLACSRCMKTYYCTAACQKEDWKQRKQTCGAAVDQA
jgi:hypothetical protein